MIFRVNKTVTIFLAILFIILFSGCAGKFPKNFRKVIVKKPPLPEQIHKQPLQKSYENAKVVVFRFTNPENYPLVGYTAADTLYKKLVGENIFKEVAPRLNSEGLSIENQLDTAKAEGFDVLITGRVLLYLDGTQYQSSRVDEEIMIYSVLSGEILWHATATTQGIPVSKKDYYLYTKAGVPPPSPSKLMLKNSEKFINMLQ